MCLIEGLMAERIIGSKALKNGKKKSKLLRCLFLNMSNPYFFSSMLLI